MGTKLVSGALALVCLTPSAVGNLLTVDSAGGGDFTDLQAAVDAASSGDVLLVSTGDYGWVDVVGKGLAIVADDGAVPSLTHLRVQAVPASESAFVAGLTMEGLEIDGCVGAARVQDCDVVSTFFSEGVVVVSCSDVVLTSCTVVGARGGPNDFIGGDGGAALRVILSNAAAFDCTFEGGLGGSGSVLDCILGGAVGGFGGFGVTVNGGLFYMMGGSIVGGQGGTADCCSPGLSEGGPGGTGILVDTNTVARLADVVLTGGAGGSPPCVGDPIGPAGPDQLLMGTLVDTGVAARTLSVAWIGQSRTQQSIQVTGEPGDRVYVARSGLPSFLDAGDPTGIWALLLPIRRPVELGDARRNGRLEHLTRASLGPSESGSSGAPSTVGRRERFGDRSPWKPRVDGGVGGAVTCLRRIGSVLPSSLDARTRYRPSTRSNVTVR